MIAPMLTVVVTPSSPVTTPCSMLGAPLLAWAKPSTDTTPAAMTSSTRKTPVIQALARRSSRPARVAASITAAPASGLSTCRTGAR